MKIKIYIGLLILLFADIRIHAQNNAPFQILGKVIIQNTDSIVPFAFIANSKTGIGKETNEKGLFRIDIEEGDTLLFRCMGFDDTQWAIDDLKLTNDTIILPVAVKNYALKDVDVLWFRSYATFRNKIANMPLQDSKTVIAFKLDLNKIIAEARAEAKAQAGNFGAGVSFGSGPKTKNQRKYDKLLAHERLYARYNKLTSHENLKAFTKLEGPKLDSFVVFLRTRHNIRPDLSEYEMMAAINEAFDAYLSLHNDSIAH